MAAGGEPPEFRPQVQQQQRLHNRLTSGWFRKLSVVSSVKSFRVIAGTFRLADRRVPLPRRRGGGGATPISGPPAHGRAFAALPAGCGLIADLRGIPEPKNWPPFYDGDRR